MNIQQLLKDYKKGKLSHNKLLFHLKEYPFEDLGHTKIDHHRELRAGFPEVIFGKGKTSEHLFSIIERLYLKRAVIIITKIEQDIAQQIQRKYDSVEYHKLAKTLVIYNELNFSIKLKNLKKKKTLKTGILIITAGTSDIPIAEEAAVICEQMDNKVEKLYDIGVAGLHRLLANKQKIFDAKVIIVIAGMEGALASVIAGLANCPVIAVPTSIGYGANFKGLAALLSMLNCCSPGVTVVNIDNGFGAGYAASKILNVNKRKI
ncbi:nickel pincer cofactor biosynthesis protein LarB [Candidatus Woesearchaeota archaeon]|nr:nickel pincer cofactor biosynthesis protein LarB [Candidatus Woesearchaeota archaeon]